MNLAVLPLLVAALLMASADGHLESARLLLAGTHALQDPSGTVVVGDADVVVPVDAEVDGPVYVIGGEVEVAGRVAGDVVQLAGVVHVTDGATVAGELRHVGGTMEVDPGATIGRRTSVAVTRAAGAGNVGLVATGVTAGLLALVGVRLVRTRGRALGNVAAAARDHAVVSLTVGALAALTAIAVVVFMAFTLVLLPVAAVAVLVGVVAVAYGVVALGHVVAARLPVRGPRRAVALGVVVVVVALQLVALVPLVGDLLALATLLTGLGAVLVSSFGVTRFHPDVLPE